MKKNKQKIQTHKHKWIYAQWNRPTYDLDLDLIIVTYERHLTIMRIYPWTFDVKAVDSTVIVLQKDEHECKLITTALRVLNVSEEITTNRTSRLVEDALIAISRRHPHFVCELLAVQIPVVLDSVAWRRANGDPLPTMLILFYRSLRQFADCLVNHEQLSALHCRLITGFANNNWSEMNTTHTNRKKFRLSLFISMPIFPPFRSPLSLPLSDKQRKIKRLRLVQTTIQILFLYNTLQNIDNCRMGFNT